MLENRSVWKFKQTLLFSNFKIFLMPWKSDFVKIIDFVISEIFKKIPVELMFFNLCYAEIFLAKRYTHIY